MRICKNRFDKLQRYVILVEIDYQDKNLTLFFISDTRHCEHCKLPSHRDVTRLVDHYKMRFNIKAENCDRKKKKILIINRNINRKILNIEHLTQSLIRRTLQDVETIAMKTVSIRKQIGKVYCSDVLIGVHGAGLTWYTINCLLNLKLTQDYVPVGCVPTAG